MLTERIPKRTIRVPDDEWEQWKQAARRQGDRSINSLVRGCVNADIARHQPKRDKAPTAGLKKTVWGWCEKWANTQQPRAPRGSEEN